MCNRRRRYRRLNINKTLDYAWITLLERISSPCIRGISGKSSSTVSPMDRHSKRPPTHLNTHSVKCSDAAGLGGVGWCFPHALLPLSRIFALILLLSADLHKSDSKPIQKKNKEIKKEKKTFILQWRYMFTEASWKRAGREKQFDGRVSASFWSSEFPVGLQWQQRTCF